MFKLKVSYDAGSTYSLHQQSGKLEELQITGKTFDDESLRWVIEDEKGHIVDASLIHKRIINFMDKMNQK